MWIDEDSEFMNISGPDLCDKEILEVGCGDGRLSVRFAEIAKRLVAVDPNEEKLRKARKRLQNYPEVRFEAGGGEKLQFPSHSFDIVFYSLSFHHLPLNRQYDAILEAKRVLKRKGKLFIYEPIAAGQMQSLFLLFEDEFDELMEVYKTVQKAEAEAVFQSIKKKGFSINWKFDSIDDLSEFFQREYGEKAVMAKKPEILAILKGQRDTKPIVLEDRLMLIELVVNK
ncbi:MAG: class I SAM-dependent methyltransferase [Candidatus Micrarchaeota archaeon]|nr:class I SAM-dependent methyltransferase [Candidatus Micrarchaeota archaeon]